MDAFLNTYKQMRNYEKSADQAQKQYEQLHQKSWLKLKKDYLIQADRLKRTLDSHVITVEVRKEAHNG